MPRNTSLLLSGVVFWMASSFIYAFPLATLGVYTESGCFPLGRLFFWILLQTSLTSNTLAVSALPQCYEGDPWTGQLIACTSVTISELDDGYLISRGMDGYSAGEFVEISLDTGPGTLSFTDFNTEEWSDYVYIVTNANTVDYTFDEFFSFTGASQPPDIDIFKATTITWSSLSGKGAGFGWVLTFTSNPNMTSTTATTMTTTIMAASALPQCIEYDTSTWEAITCTSVTISELDEGYYLISRGMDGYSAGESVSIELDSGPGTLSFTDFNTEEWSDSVYIDIYANKYDHTSIEWFSFTGASQPPDIDISTFARISWWSGSAQGAGFGWVLTFTSNPNMTSTMTTTITTMSFTTMTITTTTTVLHFSFDVSSTSCKVDVEQECVQNPDFPSMTNASQILCTGQTNLALYSTALQTDGDASLTMHDLHNPWGDDNAKLWFSDFPGR